MIQGEGLPQINMLVDAYNAISVAFRVPAGADDLDLLAPPLAYRYAREGDTSSHLEKTPSRPTHRK